MNIDKEKLMKSISAEEYYADQLGVPEKSDGKGNLYFCKFHDDQKTPNMVVFPDGKFKCFACGEGGDILAFHQHRTGLSFPDVLSDLAQKYASHLLDNNGNGFGTHPVTAAQNGDIFLNRAKPKSTDQSKRGNKTPLGEPTDRYPYHDENGGVRFEVLRYKNKQFRQRQPDGDGGWIWNLNGVETVLYRLQELISGKGVLYICEGEKDVIALCKLRLRATTAPMGAGKWKTEYNKYLAGEDVVILPDNDSVGKNSAYQIASSLYGTVKTVKIVNLPGLEEHQDVSDYLASHTVEDLQDKVKNTQPFDCSLKITGEEVLNSLDLLDSHWGKIENFKSNDLPEIPANLLPGNYGKFAKALAVATEVSEGLAVFGVLGTVSAAISHRFSVSPKQGWEESINVYLLAALPPGNNKSSVLKACSKPLVTWQQEQVKKLGPKIKQLISERKTMERLIEKERNLAINNNDNDLRKIDIHEVSEMEAKLEDLPVLPQIFVTDTTPEALVSAVAAQGGRFAILSDEGGIMEVISGLYTGGKANINIILNGIDGGYVRVERKDTSFDLSPYLTFCLFVQPIVVRNMGGKKAFKGNGMVERFLYLLPQSKLGYRTHDTEPVSKTLKDEYNLQIIELLNRYLLVGEGEDERFVLTLDEQSHEAWKLFLNQVEKELRANGKLFPIAGWGAKISGFALRLAGLIHVMKGKDVDVQIDYETMENALTLATHLKEHALAAFGVMSVDKATEKAKVVLRWIRTNGELSFTRSSCQTALHGQFEDVDELVASLDFLKERNIVKGPENVTTSGKGRPSIIYHVNPALFLNVN